MPGDVGDTGGPGPSRQSGLNFGPEWFYKHGEDIAEKAAKYTSEPYRPFGQLTPEQVKVLDDRIRILRELQKGAQEDFIPFSVTGTSQPIGISPKDLERVFRENAYAKKLIQEQTGIDYVTKEDLASIKQRARETYEINLPEIRKRESIPTTISNPPLPLSPTQSSSTTSSPSNPNAAKIAELTKYLHEIQHLPETIRKGATYKDFISNKMSPKNPLIYTVRSEGQHIGGTEISRTITELQKQIAELGGSPSVPGAPSVLASPPPSSLSSTSGSSLSQTPVTGSDIFKRAGAEREIRKLLASHGRVAPMNERHKQATRMLEKSFDDDTLELAKEELLKSQRNSPLEEAKPYINKFTSDPEEEAAVDRYVGKYSDRIRKALEDESREDFLKKVIPDINNKLAAKGQFYSSARLKLLKEAENERRKAIDREVIKLLDRSQETGTRNFQNKNIQAAQLVGDLSKSQQDLGRSRAEGLRNQALTRHALHHSNVSALGQVAKAEQDQRQNELNVEAQEFERAREHPLNELQKRSNVMHGIPVPTQTTTSTSVPIQSPNLQTIGAGVGAALLGMQNKARGGSVRKRYAEGGSVEDEIRNAIAERENRYRSQLRDLEQGNSMGSIMREVGKSILRNPRRNAIESFGLGLSNHLDNLEASRERMNNLYDKINDTKLKQYEVLAAFEQQRADRASKKEDREATREYRQNQLELQLSRLNENRDYHSARLALDNEKAHKISEKELEELEAARNEYMGMLQAKELLEKGDPLYAPASQVVSSIRPQWTKNPDQATFEKIISELKGNTFRRNRYRNQAEFKSIKEVDPNLSKEANEQIIEYHLPYVKRKLKKLEKLSGEKIILPGDRLPDSNGEPLDVAKSENTKNNSTGYVKMITPKGDLLEDVPPEKIKEFEGYGARVVK